MLLGVAEALADSFELSPRVRRQNPGYLALAGTRGRLRLLFA